MRYPDDTQTYQYSLLLGKKFPCHKCESSFTLNKEVPDQPGVKSRSWTVAVVTWGVGKSILMQEALLVKCPKDNTISCVVPIGSPELVKDEEGKKPAPAPQQKPAQGVPRGK